MSEKTHLQYLFCSSLFSLNWYAIVLFFIQLVLSVWFASSSFAPTGMRAWTRTHSHFSPFSFFFGKHIDDINSSVCTSTWRHFLHMYTHARTRASNVLAVSKFDHSVAVTDYAVYVRDECVCASVRSLSISIFRKCLDIRVIYSPASAPFNVHFQLQGSDAYGCVLCIFRLIYLIFLSCAIIHSNALKPYFICQWAFNIYNMQQQSSAKVKGIHRNREKDISN